MAAQSKFTGITTTRVSLLMIIYSPNITKGSVCTWHMLGSRLSKYKAGREDSCMGNYKARRGGMHGVIKTQRKKGLLFFPEDAREGFLEELTFQ